MNLKSTALISPLTVSSFNAVRSASSIFVASVPAAPVAKSTVFVCPKVKAEINNIPTNSKFFFIILNFKIE